VRHSPRADAVRSGRLAAGASPTRLLDEPCAPAAAGAGRAVADTGDIADALAEALADAARDLGIDLDG
jgi:hypothetical protein